MPSIEENRRLWNDTYRWTEAGDEWSERWGSAARQWHGSLLPRVRVENPLFEHEARSWGRAGSVYE